MFRDINRFSKQQYDLLIIGGGINGAAIANMAAQYGLSVALVERSDFASGTSSKSTKLIHGGLRYIEHLEFDLVKESLKERAIQLKCAPHLVKPLGFIIPVYKKDRRPLWMMRLGVSLYDFLSGKNTIKKHCSLRRQDILERVPGIKKEGLVGGVMYYDAQMDDARLCLENILSADSKGAHVANYVEVQAFVKQNLKVIGARVKDLVTLNTFEIKAKKIVCAVGPWTNFILKLDHKETPTKIRTTKGIHIVYKKQFAHDALFIQSTSDKRIFFIIPWYGHSLIGTTDTDYTGHPDDVQATDEDIEYLLRETRRIFPMENVSRDEIATTFAGLRPLVHGKGSPSDVSRKHIIEQTPSDIFYVIGGKYTTYRKIAQDCLKYILKNEKMEFPEDYTLYGSGNVIEDVQELARMYQLDVSTVQLLMDKYGTRFKDILHFVQEDPRLKEKICTCSPAIRAQVAYSIKVEMVCMVDDVIWRRLGIGYLGCKTGKCREVIERYLKKK